MMNQKMVALGQTRSVIRELFEYGNKKKAEIGEDKVFDFSLGNPNVPAPEAVNKEYIRLLETKDDVYLHGYTSAQGDAACRRAIADNLNERFGTSYTGDNLFLTCGCCAALKAVLHALYDEGDEVIAFTPYFPEYKVFVETTGAKLVEVSTDPSTFRIDLDKLEQAITEHTKTIMINSPNNPSGVVYKTETIEQLAGLLRKKEAEYGHVIYLLTDEPYRELVYDEGTAVPFVPNYYEHAIVCYSYSKSLSLPGERIGYVLLPDTLPDKQIIYAGVAGASRFLGHVCPPSLAQHMLEKCADQVADLTVYKTNRDLLYKALTEYGYTCVYPDGAFYMFVKALEDDAVAFSERAKKDYNLLLVPSDSFGVKGYVRIAYCVTTELIKRSLPAFKALAESYGK
ncbi:MAG: pyridoxal phosphate-dependent aminotransferase [Eubacterium sp.]|nr:pyridoxal phosphate-dependent aminotransferase [Eubacterium sp.]